MPLGKDVRVDDRNGSDYKSVVKTSKVSVKTLRFMITQLEKDIERNLEAASLIRRELDAIIESIGEEW
jgi:hypothetical protein